MIFHIISIELIIDVVINGIIYIFKNSSIRFLSKYFWINILIFSQPLNKFYRIIPSVSNLTNLFSLHQSSKFYWISASTEGSSFYQLKIIMFVFRTLINNFSCHYKHIEFLYVEFVKRCFGVCKEIVILMELGYIIDNFSFSFSFHHDD